MTYEELLDKARQLPVMEQLRLLEGFSHSVRAAMATSDSDTRNDARQRETWKEDRKRLLENVPPESSLHELLGIVHTDEPPPTDEEIKEEYHAYLEKKYS